MGLRPAGRIALGGAFRCKGFAQVGKAGRGSPMLKGRIIVVVRA